MKLYKYTDGRANASGQKIKERREAAGLSQEELAAQLQLAGLNRIETGDRVVPDFELLYFSKVLNVQICELLPADE